MASALHPNHSVPLHRRLRSEPESLIPLTKGSRHVVLVGDHCQLPPVIKSDVALQGGLSVSMFERLIKAGAPSSMLQV